MTTATQPLSPASQDKLKSFFQLGLQYRVGVRGDGTFRIWAEQRLNLKKRFGNYEWLATDLPIGDGTNWLAVAGEGEKIVTLKNDGSLWLWDFHLQGQRMDWNADRFEREIQNTRPVRLGTHSDWIAISGYLGNVNALAADGSVWFWPLENTEYYYGGSSNLDPIHPLLDISHKPQRLGNIFSQSD